MKRIIIFIFVILGLVTSSYSILNDSALYYSADNSNISGSNILDISGNNRDGNITGATTGATGILFEALDYDGLNDWATFPYFDYWNGNDRFSVSTWVNFDQVNTGTAQAIAVQFASSSTYKRWFLYEDSGVLTIIGSGPGTTHTGTSTLNTGKWYHVAFISNGTHVSLYINNTLELSGITGQSGKPLPNQIGSIGARAATASNYLDGRIDETVLYARNISLTELAQLYNNGTGFNPYAVGQNIITTNLNNWYNITSFSVDINTSLQSDISYFVDSNSSTLLCNNCFNATANLIGITEKLHNFTVSADSGAITNLTQQFGVDLTPPNISIIGNITQDTFIINFANIFNVTDSLSGVDNCNLNITYLSGNETDNNFFINCTALQTFTRAGLYNGFLEATDNAGNVATLSVNGTINPVNYVFYNYSGGIVFNYTATVYHPSGAITIPPINPDGSISISPLVNGTLDLGIYNVTFEKLGFVTTNSLFNITATTNQTFIVQVGISLLHLNIFDTDTDTLILQNVSIQLIGPSFAGRFSTSNGTITIDNITAIPDFYQLILDSNGYAQLNYIFQHTGFEAVNLSLYMQTINETTPILYIVEDKLGNRMGSSEEFPKCLVQVSEYDIVTNSYILQTMDYTNSNGEIIFDIDTTKNIKNTVICDSGTFIFEGEKITSTPVLLTIGADPIEYFDSQLNLRYTPINYTQVDNVTGRFSLAYSDSNAILTQACLNVSQILFNSEVFISEQCLTTATGSLNIDFNTSEGETYIARAQFIYNSEQYKVPSYVKTIPINYEDLGLVGLFFTLLLVFALGLAGLTAPKGAKFLGVLFGGTVGLWIGSVVNFIPMNYYVLTTWSVLLILGAMFS